MRDETDLLERIERLSVMSRNGYRAPHKPLLLLLALGRCLAGHDRLEGYSELEKPLTKLLARFGPPRKRHAPEAPFGWLRTEGLWEIPGGEFLPANSWGTLSRSGLVRNKAKGGFPEHIHRLLQRDRSLARKSAQLILDRHFPPTLHQSILESVGLPVEPAGLWKRAAAARNPEFRKDVLHAYGGRCAVCGFDVRMGNETVGIEAAHIKWHSQNGPDTVRNGLALCALHHVALDRGVFGLRPRSGGEGYELAVSEHASSRTSIGKRILGTEGARIRMPARGSPEPGPEFVAWYSREVFRRPGVRVA